MKMLTSEFTERVRDAVVHNSSRLNDSHQHGRRFWRVPRRDPNTSPGRGHRERLSTTFQSSAPLPRPRRTHLGSHINHQFTLRTSVELTRASSSSWSWKSAKVIQRYREIRNTPSIVMTLKLAWRTCWVHATPKAFPASCRPSTKQHKKHPQTEPH